MLRTSVKSISRRFYYDNAGLFLIGSFIFFGFLRGEQHLALAQSISQNDPVLVASIFIYTLYTLATLLYTRKILRSNENRFLWSMGETPKLRSTVIFLYNQSLMNLPTTTHSVLVLYFSLINNKSSAWLIVAYLFLAHTLPVWSIQRLLLSQPFHVRPKTSLLSSISLKLPKPPWSWYLINSLRKNPAHWLLGKPISVLTLQGFLWINEVEKYPLTWLALGVLICVFINTPILYQFHLLEKGELSLNKNLPWSTWVRLARISLSIIVLFAAEILVLGYNYLSAYSLVSLLSLLSLIPFISLTIFTALARFNLDQETFYKRCFWSFMLLFAIILSGVPLILLSIISLSITLFFYRSYYNLFIH